MKESIKKRVEALVNGNEGKCLNPLELLIDTGNNKSMNKSEIIRRYGKNNPLIDLMEMGKGKGNNDR